MRSRFLLALFVLFTLACSGGRNASPEGINILLVVLDTVRADRFSSYGNPRNLTPFMDGLAARGVRVGSCAVPVAAVRGPHLFGPEDDPLVSAWILDDRGGVVSLLRLLERVRQEGLVPARTVHCCFTVQEEGGLIGARGWAHRNSVEIFIAVDSTPVPAGCQLEVDGRPAAWSKDARVHFDQGLLGDMARAARRAGTELQVAVYAAAASDASAVLEAGLAPRALTVGYPRYNSHGYEVTRLRVFSQLTAMLYTYLEDLT